jgi:NADP-dependent alcohol dehydrogenase
MNNFDFYNPVKILFGKGRIEAIASEIPANSVVMLTYGGGSIKRNGVYELALQALKGFKVIEFGGIEPNPKFETLMKAVELARSEKVTFILAVGGGSVIDGTKFIAAAIPFSDDTWKIVKGGREGFIEKAIPFGTVLTLPATGSEMNSGAVISRLTTGEKFAFGSPLLYPKFSVLDPTFTFSLPRHQVANGIVDAFIHVTEQYITFPANAPVQDRWAEGILQTLIEIGPRTIEQPTDYETRAAFMWACTMALNGIISTGVPSDWATHMIGHELTAFFGLDHAVTLAIVLPSLLLETSDEKKDKLLQYGDRVWGLTTGSEEERISMTISKTHDFFRSLGIKTTLSDYGVTSNQIQPIIERFEQRGWKLGENKSIDASRIQKILMGCF